MAKTTAFRCDRCKQFEESEHLPEGWMILQAGPKDTERTTFDICSNACLAELAVERANELDGQNYKLSKMRASRTPSALKLEAGKADGRKLWGHHLSAHRQKQVIDENCMYCQRETEPVQTEPAKG